MYTSVGGEFKKGERERGGNRSERGIEGVIDWERVRGIRGGRWLRGNMREIRPEVV